MTLKELSQLTHLKREISLLKKRLREYESGTVPGGINDNPSRGSEISDKTGRLAAEIADIKAIISAKKEQCIHERIRLERYINEIDDSLTRQIFTLRFADGMKWWEVADELGGNNTADSCRMICYRYIGRN